MSEGGTVAAADVAEVAPGLGVLSFPAAARVIHKRPQTLRRWVRSGLTPVFYGKGTSGSDVLSFHDLISLEVVRRFRAEGVSLQRVRVLESEMRRRFRDVSRPFALKGFFTDGVAVWHELEPDDDRLVEIVGRRQGALAWKPAIQTFARKIHYDDHNLARSWDLSKWVHIDPHIQFGTPVVRGTRITVDALRANLEVGSPEQVADWYDLTVDQVNDVRDTLAA